MGSLEVEFHARLAGTPRVHWLGFRRDVPAIMKALDVLVVPSHYEGFGLVAGGGWRPEPPSLPAA